MDKITRFGCVMVQIIFYYRNHEIKNIVSKAIRAFEGYFYYPFLGSKTMQTISITYTMMQNCILKQCHKF